MLVTRRLSKLKNRRKIVGESTAVLVPLTTIAAVPQVVQVKVNEGTMSAFRGENIVVRGKKAQVSKESTAQFALTRKKITCNGRSRAVR